MKMDVISIFEVPLLCARLDLDVSSIEQYCWDYSRKNVGRQASNAGGYQSNDLPKEDTPLTGLVQEIEKYYYEMAEVFAFQNTSLKLDNMWFNINGYKDFNQMHRHPACAFSGVYYVKTPENCGNIVFENPAEILEYANALIPYKAWNQFNTVSHWRKAEENLLYVFPGWLRHSVEPNLSNEKRISISFNSH